MKAHSWHAVPFLLARPVGRARRAGRASTSAPARGPLRRLLPRALAAARRDRLRGQARQVRRVTGRARPPPPSPPRPRRRRRRRGPRLGSVLLVALLAWRCWILAFCRRRSRSARARRSSGCSRSPSAARSTRPPWAGSCCFRRARRSGSAIAGSRRPSAPSASSTCASGGLRAPRVVARARASTGSRRPSTWRALRGALPPHARGARRPHPLATVLLFVACEALPDPLPAVDGGLRRRGRLAPSARWPSGAACPSSRSRILCLCVPLHEGLRWARRRGEPARGPSAGRARDASPSGPALRRGLGSRSRTRPAGGGARRRTCGSASYRRTWAANAKRGAETTRRRAGRRATARRTRRARGAPTRRGPSSSCGPRPRSSRACGCGTRATDAPRSKGAVDDHLRALGYRFLVERRRATRAAARRLRGRGGPASPDGPPPAIAGSTWRCCANPAGRSGRSTAR